MSCTGTGGEPLTPLQVLQLRAMDEKLSDKEFEKSVMDIKMESREDILEMHRIVKKYRPKVARKLEKEIFNKGSGDAFSALRSHLIGKTVKDVRKAESGYGIELILEGGDVVTCQIEGGKDSPEPEGLIHWFVARVNLKEWFRT
jgi:hypothetical protein